MVPGGPLPQQPVVKHSAAYHSHGTHGPTKVHIPSAHITGVIGQGTAFWGEGGQGYSKCPQNRVYRPTGNWLARGPRRLDSVIPNLFHTD